MKKILVISDMHIGKRVSLMPDEVYIDSAERKMVITSNDIQKKIYRKWEEMLDEVGRVDAVINLGDTCDGTNRKSQGTGLWTTDINLQMEVAKDLLGMVKTTRYIGVQGSYYHVGDNLSSDKSVIEGLGGQFGDELAVVVGDKRIHICHDIGVSSSGLAYRTSALAQQLMMASLHADEFRNFNLILRGHSHYSLKIEFPNSIGAICPCWCGRDEFVARRSLAWVPHLGYLIVNVRDKIDVDIHAFTLSGKNLMKEVSI
jgi:predicted phosphodiesterase